MPVCWHLLLLFWLHWCSVEAGRGLAGTRTLSAWPGLLLAVFGEGWQQRAIAVMRAQPLCFGGEVWIPQTSLLGVHGAIQEGGEIQHQTRLSATMFGTESWAGSLCRTGMCQAASVL